MREITSRRVNPANDTLRIAVRDAPGTGGACHCYVIDGFSSETNPSDDLKEGGGAASHLMVLFQNGPIAESGVNGVTHEALLAIVADRLQSFQAGPYACAENADALRHVEAAQEALLSRTRARMERGVEGTHTV